jgi:hypothetical protein
VWWPADRAADRYRYLPVEVPAGARALTVTLDYDAGAGVLDLGCFDPDGRFRGWSGGARSTFAVAAATPGYLPGPLPPGEWRVALGLHWVPLYGLVWTCAGATASCGVPQIQRRLRPGIM